MNVTILKDVSVGYKRYKRGDKIDIHPVIAGAWLKEKLAIADHVDVEDEPEDQHIYPTEEAEQEEAEDQERDYDIEADVVGDVDEDQPLDERVKELMEAHTVSELKEIHETLIGKKPHWKANEVTIATAIAQAERE